MLIEVAVVLFELRFDGSKIGRVVGGTFSAAIFISGVIFEVFPTSPVYWRASPIGLDGALIALHALSILMLQTDFSVTLVTTYATLSGTFRGT